MIAYLCTLKGLDLLFIPPADHQGKEDLYRNKKIGQWKHEACGQLHVKYKCTRVHVYMCVHTLYMYVCVCHSVYFSLLPASQFIQLYSGSDDQSVASGLLAQLETATHSLISSSSSSSDRYTLTVQTFSRRLIQ